MGDEKNIIIWIAHWLMRCFHTIQGQ